VNKLDRQLEAIEKSLLDGSYRPGPWGRFVDEAMRRPRTERRSVADQATRVSELLHRRHGRPETRTSIGVLIGLLAAGAGFALVEMGRDSGGIVLLTGAVLLIVALQPLFKMSVGFVLGLRFSSTYLRGIEPRAKLRYGTYLAATRPSRIAFHLSGTVGSPAGAAWAWLRAAPDTSGTTIAAVLFWVLVAVQLLTLVLGLTGRGRQLARISSGGMMGKEIRAALRRSP
jgi:hypothetical protein